MNKATTSTKKAYVLDTNVLMHDPDSIFAFKDNDIIIPFVVIIELDRNKKDHWSSRESSRLLDSIMKNMVGDTVEEGYDLGQNSLGEKLGVLFIENIVGKILIQYSDENKNDANIISTAIMAIKQNKKSKKYKSVALVSKDLNVRIASISNNVPAEDYENDKSSKYKDAGKIFPDSDDYPNGIHSVRYQVLKSNEEGYKFRKIWNKDENALLPYSKNVFGIRAKNNEQECVLQALLDNDIDVVALTGSAGTGKTFLALLAAMSQKENGIFDGIVVARPNVSIKKDYDLGFKPGGTNQKMQEWMLPIIDNMDIILSGYTRDKISKTKSRIPGSKAKDKDANLKSFFLEKKAQEIIDDETVVIQPLESIRGRSLKNKIFIIDEAQNLTPKDMKTIITRCGEGTKIVLTGDLTQIDALYLDENSNGLAYLIDRFINQSNFCYISLKEVLRSRIAEQGATLL